jgi:hypothetical protein
MTQQQEGEGNSGGIVLLIRSDITLRDDLSNQRIASRLSSALLNQSCRQLAGSNNSQLSSSREVAL